MFIIGKLNRVWGRGVEIIGRGESVWWVNQLLHAGDIMLLGDSREKVHELLTD